MPTLRFGFSVATACLMLLGPPLIFAQYGLPLDELTLGLSQRNDILSKCPPVVGTAANVIAQSVFSSLLNTSAGRSGGYLPFEVTLIDCQSVNALSTAAGKVYLTSGIVPVLGEDSGLWSAAMSHEIAHTVRHHHYNSYLRWFQLQTQIAYYRARAAAGDNSANWALLGAAIGGRIANLKLSRDEEHDADRTGLMMMAEAGYHPDFAITMQRRMAARVGDQSKFTAFFSDHPRWATREQRTLKAYDDAIDVFESRWPDPETSPGGLPPIISDFGQIFSKEDKVNIGVIIQVSFSMRNAKGRQIMVVAVFDKDKRPVFARLPEFQGKDGALVARTMIVPQSNRETLAVRIAIPTAALVASNRKLSATVAVVAGGEVVAFSKPIKVKFPKAKVGIHLESDD